MYLIYSKKFRIQEKPKSKIFSQLLNLAREEKNFSNGLENESKIYDNIQAIIQREIEFLKKGAITANFRELNESLTPEFDVLTYLPRGDSAISLKELTLIDAVDSIVRRFPELDYLIDLISTSAVYFFKQSGKKYGIEINLVLRNKKGDVPEIRDLQNLKFEILDLLQDNNFYQEGKETLNNVIKYGFSLAYFSPDYKSVEFLSPKDVKIKIKSNVKDFKSLSLSNLEFEDITGKKLDKKRIYIFSQKGLFGNGGLRNIIPYFEIIELLETSLLIERLAKAKTLFVWLMNIENLEEDEVSSFTALYKSILKSKVSITKSEGNNIRYDIGKSFLDNHAIIPIMGENMLKIESLKSEYKPILEDINYFWEKVYYSMGIPLYYRNMDLKNIPKVALQMHDRAFAMRIYIYQTVLNKFLTYWIEKIIEEKGFNIKYLNVSLIPFTPAEENKETDIDKAKKFIDIITQAQDFLGIQFKKEWILKMMFPDQDLEQMIAKETPVEENIEGKENIQEAENEDILKEIFGEETTTENIEENKEESMTVTKRIKELKKERIKKLIKENSIKITSISETEYDLEINFRI